MKLTTTTPTLTKTLTALAFSAVLSLTSAHAAEGAKPQSSESGIAPTFVRCEFKENPVGVGAEKPMLMWEVKAADPKVRGLTQSAYQVLVASSKEKLGKDEGDQWDSSKIASADTLNIAYGGKPLISLQRVWWKVRIWDKDGKPSAWSEPSSWTMAVKPADWKAEWITRDWKEPEKKANTGWSSIPSVEPEKQVGKWVAFDLGQSKKIEAVRLYPILPFFCNGWGASFQNSAGLPSPGFGFPKGFVVEGAEQSDFSDAKKLGEYSVKSIQFEEFEPVAVSFPPTTARFVRIRITVPGTAVFKADHKMKDMRPFLQYFTDEKSVQLKERGMAGFACSIIGEMEVVSEGKPLSAGVKVTATDSIEDEKLGLGLSCLTDGQKETVVSIGFMNQLHPSLFIRKEFRVERPVKQEILSATALGTYLARMNGKDITGLAITPPWTLVEKIEGQTNEEGPAAFYQSYDVTDALVQGDNALGFILGDGWRRDRGMFADANLRNSASPKTIELAGQLDIEYPARPLAAASLAEATGQPKNSYKIMVDKIIFNSRAEKRSS